LQGSANLRRVLVDAGRGVERAGDGLGTPWVRIQLDTARSFRISCALTCSGGAVVGAYFSQARVAAWNVGEERDPRDLTLGGLDGSR
jgi:hypothetical protein